MDVMAKTGERQRRSGVSKWNFGGGASTSSCLRPWRTARGGCGCGCGCGCSGFGGDGGGRGSCGWLMDVVAKTGERQRRSGVSKWNFGGGASTSSCWLPWHTAGGSCGGLVGMLQCLMTAAEVALGAPVVRPGNDLGNSMSIRPGMVAGGRGRSQGRMAVKAKLADSWLFLTVTRREKSRREQDSRCSLPSQRHLPCGGCPGRGGEGGWRAVDRATRCCTDMQYRGSVPVRYP